MTTTVDRRADTARAGLAWRNSEPLGEWVAEARCAQGPPQSLPFTEIETASDATRAIAVCMSCPVRAACLDYGQRSRVDGVWGGVLLRRGRRRRRGPPRDGRWVTQVDAPFVVPVVSTGGEERH